ncbi:MAG TPA: ATP synthase F0 subunit B [Pyrinomonadaceae bacterium]|nr:ATP synthase F0 subunit B [Pyrinomonadaceae bacterium]
MLLLFAGDGGWLNYPGLELWKFVNLAIFVGLGIYFLRRPINQGLLARRGAIQQELVAAQAERDQAMARVAEADSLLSRLDDDVRTVHEQSQQEAEQERQRLAAGTEREIEKLKQQGQREMERADKLARKELREYLAKRSVELARESLRNQIRLEDDTLLIKESIGELRRTRV